MSNTFKHILTVITLLQALSASSQFLGGNDDGSNMLHFAEYLSDVNLCYYGSNDDGHGQYSLQDYLLDISTCYYGGNDDGHNQYLFQDYLLNINSCYYGGNDDGHDQYSFQDYLLDISTCYYGGNDDGHDLFSFSDNLLDLSFLYLGSYGDGYGMKRTGIYLSHNYDLYYGGHADGYGFQRTGTYLSHNYDLYYGSYGDGYGMNRSGTYLSHNYELFYGGSGDGYERYSTSALLGVGFWTGLSSTSWYEYTNWAHNIQPYMDSDVVIPAGCPNYPYLYYPLGVNNYNAGGNVCRSLRIEQGGLITCEHLLFVSGEMYVAGEYTNISSMESSQLIDMGGVLEIDSGGVVRFGNQSTGPAVTDLEIQYGGELKINVGGYLEVDDQLRVYNGGKIEMTRGELFLHKYGEGSALSPSQPANLYIESGATGSFSGGTLKVCGKESVDSYHSLSILEPSVNFSDSVEIVFTNGVSATHYNTSIFTAPGLSFQNLSVDKPGNTVAAESDLFFQKQLKIYSGSVFEVKSGFVVETGE